MARSWTDISAGTGRAYQFVVRQPSWVGRLAVGAAVLILAGVVILLVVPALVIGAVVFLGLAAVAKVRSWFGGLRAPNGALDGRRNVRVIVRE